MVETAIAGDSSSPSPSPGGFAFSAGSIDRRVWRAGVRGSAGALSTCIFRLAARESKGKQKICVEKLAVGVFGATDAVVHGNRVV